MDSNPDSLSARLDAMQAVVVAAVGARVAAVIDTPAAIARHQALPLVLIDTDAVTEDYTNPDLPLVEVPIQVIVGIGKDPLNVERRRQSRDECEEIVKAIRAALIGQRRLAIERRGRIEYDTAGFTEHGVCRIATWTATTRLKDPR